MGPLSFAEFCVTPAMSVGRRQKPLFHGPITALIIKLCRPERSLAKLAGTRFIYNWDFR
jgi:hypothetical protein